MTIEAMTSAIASGIRICGMFRSQKHPNRQMQGSSSRQYTPSKSASGSYEECDMDNMGAVQLVQALGGIIPDRPETIFGGSKTSRIQELAIEIDDLYIEANIDRHTFWVQREHNVEANYMSKILISDPFIRLHRTSTHLYPPREPIRPPHNRSLRIVKQCPCPATQIQLMVLQIGCGRPKCIRGPHPPYLLISWVIRNIQ
jgi:hypothetical protein